MREIKFRARSCESFNDEKIHLMEGDWLYFTMNDGPETVGNVFWDNKTFCVHGFECDPKTITEFTGLKDKNGKEIFEGDIIKLESIVPRGDGTYDDDLFEVRYNMAHWEVHNNLIPCTEWLEEMYIYCEVIGNIYENPDLLG